MISIYTDGSAKGNGTVNSRGGFGVVVVETTKLNKVINCFQKAEDSTTNNRQEMKAIIWALKHYGKNKNIPIVYSDSMYCINTFTKWMWNWKANQWKKNNNKTPENLDLIQFYDLLINKGYKINLQYVKGHSGEFWNEIADNLATGKITANEVMEKYG